MVLKDVSAAIMGTTLLAWSGLALADGYRPDEFLASTFPGRCCRRSRLACPAIRSGSARGQHRSRK